MKNRIWITLSIAMAVISGLSLVATGEGSEHSTPASVLALTATALTDLWVHPRGATYDSNVHYKGPDGELFFHEENDIAQGIGSVVVHGGSDAPIRVDLGADLWAFIERNQGSLRPVFLHDSDGDGKVDKTFRGTIENRNALFAGGSLSSVDWRGDYWQMGVIYRAGSEGASEFNGRYLSSVDSDSAQIQFPRPEGLARVDAGPEAGLVILKHRGDAPIDLRELARDPSSHLEDFTALSRADDDGDDWTASDERPDKGRLRSHFEREDLFLVRATGDTTLAVEWGDMPLQEYLEEHLLVKSDADGCLSTLDSTLSGDDESQAPLPNRILYCPEASTVLFDAPDGYQIGLSAMRGEEALERTEASTSIVDNIRLYAKEINTRGPRARATGTVLGNVKAGMKDAGLDVIDIGRHLVTGTERVNLHTGQSRRRTSLLMAVPSFVIGLAKLKPGAAFGNLFDGLHSGVQVAADSMSAVNNAVLNPIIQSTVGTIGSPEAADTANHWLGAFTQAWAQNLPISERTADALSPVSLWNHNRAFAPIAFTRTDTQLNIDRVFTLANIAGIYGIAASAGGGAGGSGGSNGGGGAGASTAGPPAAAPAPVAASAPAPAPAAIPDVVQTVARLLCI